MTAPLVSVVMPVHNGVDYLPESLASVYSQTLTSWELLLIDDGSSDASIDLLRREAAARPHQVRYLEHPDHVNLGTLATRVLGARAASSDIVALLDQDDVWDKHYLEDHLAIWVRADSLTLGMSYGPGTYWFPTASDRDFIQVLPGDSPRVFSPGELLEAFLSSGYENTPCPSCALVRREAVLEAERFGSSARMSHCEDQYLWWSVALRWPVSVHRTPMVRYRQHSRSALVTLTASPAQRVKAELTFLNAIWGDVASALPDAPVLRTMRARIETLRQWS